MIFNKHSNLAGSHAFLSASKFHWLNYNDDQLMTSFINSMAADRGTKLHALACDCIKLKVRLPRNHCTLNAYVNDAINYDMTPEQVLYYSDNCFGTADAICFRDKLLRIHDLKTGTVVPGHMEQLKIYNALFCLEYHIGPEKLNTELRIYQNDDVMTCRPEPEEILVIMDKIIDFDKKIEKMKEEGVFGYGDV